MVKIRKIIDFCRRQVDKECTKTVLLYLCFLVISFIFWLVLTLSNSFQRDYDIPVRITSIPDSTTLITDPPKSIRVALKDRGTVMLKYALGNLPTLTIDFKTYSKGDGVLQVSSADLRSAVRGVLSNTATVTSISPDSIKILYTELPGKKVPIRFDLDVQPNLQYVINGAVTSNVDSVTVYSDRKTLAELNEVYTYKVEERELVDTLHREVAIMPMSGVKIVPHSIRLTIPVEQLINKNQNVPVMTVHVPKNLNVLTFPAVVEVSFLVPQSMYRKNIDVKVAVDYNDILETNTNKAGLKVIEVPAICKAVSLSVDSVEYLIEKH